MAIGELSAEEQGDEGRHVKGAEDERLLPALVEAEARQITEGQLEPCAPDEELQEHHDRQPEFEPGLHRRCHRRVVSTVVHASLRHTTRVSRPAARPLQYAKAIGTWNGNQCCGMV